MAEPKSTTQPIAVKDAARFAADCLLGLLDRTDLDIDTGTRGTMRAAVNMVNHALTADLEQA